VRLAMPYQQPHIKMLRIVGGLLFVTYLLYSFSGVRHAKLETGIYWMVFFGLIYGSVFLERWYGEALGAPAPEEARRPVAEPVPA
jgi:hypothetical protein